jgi:hypothetical protein
MPFIPGLVAQYGETVKEIKKKYINFPDVIRDWDEWSTFPKQDNCFVVETNSENGNINRVPNIAAYEDSCNRHSSFLSGLTIPLTDNVNEYLASNHYCLLYCLLIADQI